MPEADKREQYQTRYGTYINRDDTGAPTDVSASETLIADNVDAEGQITSIEIYSSVDVQIAIQSVPIENGEDALPFDDSINTTGTPVPKLNLVGNSEYELGDFEDPAAEVGSRSQIQVVALSSVDAPESIAVNVRVDEHLG